MFVYKPKTGNIPIKIWMSEDDYYSDKGMVEQCENLAALPFVYHHIALLPDGHVGYGMPIGGVMATQGVIVPNAVGVDIGCGVQALKTNLQDIDTATLKSIMGNIRKLVPVGFNHRKEAQEWEGFDRPPDVTIIFKELQRAKYQLGTLGGGNHFIEIQKGSDGYIWIMIHSGSRNFGYKIANEYHKRAVELCEKWYSNIPDNELAFLLNESGALINTPGSDYLNAMNYALSFARENRNRIMMAVEDSFALYIHNIAFGKPIDVHHNYAVMEHHFGKNVMVHRKGAIRARDGDIGIIPGSQGTASYIVKGKGNPGSFCSCSHGAGRRMGRKQARRELDFDTEVRKLDEQGIVHAIRHVDDLDEASGAYKDIDEVMEAQSDLVEIVVKLTPLGVIKG